LGERTGEGSSFPVELGYLAQDFPFLLRSLRGYIRAVTADTFSGLDTEPGEIVILNLVGINPGVSQNDLAAALVIQKSAVTKTIKHLEARGLLERRKPKKDRRFNALSLTPKGEEKLASMRARMSIQHDILFDGFTQGEQMILFEQLVKLLTRLHSLHRDNTPRPERGDRLTDPDE